MTNYDAFKDEAPRIQFMMHLSSGTQKRRIAMHGNTAQQLTNYDAFKHESLQRLVLHLSARIRTDEL